MRKNPYFWKQGFCLALTGTLLFGNVPAAASADLFGDGIFNDGTADSEVFSDDTVWDDQVSANDGQELMEEGVNLTEEEIREQLAPMENLVPIPAAPDPDSDLDGGISMYGLMPSRYDPRAQYGTPVKNQNPFGICWAFTVAAGMELSLRFGNMGLYDLSEEHLAYFFANRCNDPLKNTADDRNIHKGADYHQGGNQINASVFLSSWSGMTTENEVPLPTDSTNTAIYSWEPPASKAYESVAYLTEAAFSQYSVNRAKELIYQYGAVGISVRVDQNYYNPSTCAYSYPVTNATPNHAVTLVGWDDSYPAANFSAASGVKGNGAWIVKNSWGKKWGDGGYFYISYEDRSGRDLTAVAATTNPVYKNNYFYDGACNITTLKVVPKGTATGSSSINSLANVFTAKAGKGKAEALGEVVLASYSDNCTFGIQVYTNLADPSDPISGIAAYDRPFVYNQQYAGISTVSIPEVPLIQGSSYSIVVTNEGSNTFKYMVESSSDGGWVSYQAGTEAGQSFYKDDVGIWTDAWKSRFCFRVKAHTRTLSTQAVLNLNVEKTSLKIGETTGTEAKITVPANVKCAEYIYYSSNESVVTVNSKGQIKGISPGSAVIYCEGAGLKASVKITVKKPETPSGIKGEASNYTRADIFWNKVSGISGYEIYRKASGENYRKIANVAASEVSYTDKTVLTGERYSYKIRAYNTVRGSRVYGAFSAEASAAPVLKKAAVTVKTSADVYNKVSWKKVPGASGYRVYRRRISGSWARIADVSAGIFAVKDKDVTPLQAYEYMVRAYRRVNGRAVLAPSVKAKRVKTAPARQRISSITSKANGLRLAWNPQKKADGYRIYRRTSKGSWKFLAEVSGGSRSFYLDQTAKKGVRCYYCVRAIAEETGGRVYSKYTAKAAVRK